LVRAHILVSGRVQGVGFRYFTASQARRLGVGGSVRNLPDGAVEIIAEGDRSALEALIAAVRRGPTGAVVRDVRVEWEDVNAPRQEFVIR
jgi:acylphosphatase